MSGIFTTPSLKSKVHICPSHVQNFKEVAYELNRRAAIAVPLDAPLERTSSENPFQLRDKLERVMWTKLGVMRNGPDMTAALPGAKAAALVDEPDVEPLMASFQGAL